MNTTETDTKAAETKTVAATWAAFLASGAAITVLQGLDLSGLPQWAASAVGIVLTAALTYLVGYNTKHRPGKLSLSAIRALRQRGEA
jgi:hypothetical protein